MKAAGSAPSSMIYLLALTARRTGTPFVTCGPHCASIRRRLRFAYQMLS
jgi:hypothetical protein